MLCREKVTIPKGKGYVLMQGGGIEKTIIDWGDHQTTDTSATFTAYPNNIVITNITFKVHFFVYISIDTYLINTPLTI